MDTSGELRGLGGKWVVHGEWGEGWFDSNVAAWLDDGETRLVNQDHEA